MDLHQLIVKNVESGVEVLDNSDHMPAGHNGPYHDPETPVRNTSHWTLTFLKAHRITGEQKYLEAAEKCISYLTSKEVRPHGYTFHHRDILGKDACNGLIGQAWSIEALVAAGRQLEKTDLLDLARSVFLIHPFNETFDIWKIIDTDGSNKGYDLTLNHQIWFAASGAMIVASEIECDQIERQIERFLNGLNSITHLYPSGLVYHNVFPKNNLIKMSAWSIENINRRRVPMPIMEQIRTATKKKQREKAIGYHSFNLYALAMLKQVFPNHSIWSSKLIDKILNYGQSTAFRNDIDSNPYSYSFNCSGIEMAVVEHIFHDNTGAAREWLCEQFDRTLDPETKLLTKNTEDTATMSARIYEATRLPNISNVC